MDKRPVRVRYKEAAHIISDVIEESAHYYILRRGELIEAAPKEICELLVESPLPEETETAFADGTRKAWLRDRYAAAALSGLLARPAVKYGEGMQEEWDGLSADDIKGNAERAYLYADAMLAARDKNAVRP